MSCEVVIAYDLGTSGVKAAVVDPSGTVLRTAVGTYHLQTDATGRAHQDPEEYWAAVCRTTRQVLASRSECETVVGAVCCSQWKGIILADSQGQALYPCITWLDSSASAQASYLNRVLETDEFSPQSYWAKLLWLKQQEPELFVKAAMILEVNSYIKMKLTGVAAVDVTNHFTDAEDPETRSHYRQILSASGIDPSKFPAMVPIQAQVGAVTSAAAQATGLQEGIPVFGGCGDIPAIALGIGCAGCGDVHAYFGTSGWIGVTTKAGSHMGAMASSLLLPGREILLNTMQTVGLSIDWTIRRFYPQEAESMGQDIFPWLEQELETVPPGSQGLLALPWLNGELPPWSPYARAGFLNASAIHGRAHFLHAMMESICWSMRIRKSSSEAILGTDLKRLRVTGGGAGGQHWMQMLADMLELPIEIPCGHRHSGTIGAAFCAWVGNGTYHDFDECRRQVKLAHVLMPQKDRKAIYNELCGRYDTLYRCLEPFFETLQDK